MDGRGLAEWLSGKGVDCLLKEIEEKLQSASGADAAYRQWWELRPEFIKQVPDETWQQFCLSEDPSKLFETSTHPGRDQVEQICQLLEWHAAGSGKWAGQPAYELLPERILWKFTIGEIIGALDSISPSESQLEGAAKLLANPEYGNPGAGNQMSLQLIINGKGLIVAGPHSRIDSVPTEWRQRFLRHGLASDDPEKKRRAELAYGEGDPADG